jgi:hypothetical protein
MYGLMFLNFLKYVFPAVSFWIIFDLMENNELKGVDLKIAYLTGSLFFSVFFLILEVHCIIVANSKNSDKVLRKLKKQLKSNERIKRIR